MRLATSENISEEEKSILFQYVVSNIEKHCDFDICLMKKDNNIEEINFKIIEFLFKMKEDYSNLKFNSFTSDFLETFFKTHESSPKMNKLYSAFLLSKSFGDINKAF